MRVVIPLLVGGALTACRTGPVACGIDSDCDDGDLCTRNHVCLPPSEIREVHITWTVGGMAASDATCRGMQFTLEFIAEGHYDPLAYAPVPCAPGTFRVDKLPTVFNIVHVIHGSFFHTVAIDPSTGEAAFETSSPR